MKVIIVGAGEVGFHLAQWLESERKEIVMIDKNPEVLKWVIEHLDVMTIRGSGSDPRVLEEAGLKQADVLLAATDSDEVNLTCCYFANLIAPDIQKVLLARNEEYARYHEKVTGDLKINTIINPDAEVIRSLQRIINAPEVEEINDFVGGQIKMVGKHLSASSPLNGVKISKLPEKYKNHPVIIAAIVRDEQLIVPKGNDSLRAEDLVYFVFKERHFGEIIKSFGWQSKTLKNIMIFGGGNIGFGLAQSLEGNRYNVKLIEKDPERCQTLSRQLRQTIVLQGNATDQVFLEQENIGRMDLVVAMTRDEEMNILSCLLAKRLGAQKTVARVNNIGYMPLVQAVGIDHIVSPRMAAMNSIFPYLHRGRVISTVSIKGVNAEVLEAVALESSEITGRALKNLRFPKEALILCIFRDREVIIPDGNSVIFPDDRVVILSTREGISRVEQVLAHRGTW